MQGVIRVNGKPETIRLRVAVKNQPAEAETRVTDCMLQPGPSTSGWLPHVTEIPWSDGLTFLNTAPGGEMVFWDDVQGKPVVFPPAPHSHGWADISGKPVVYPPEAHSHGAGDVAGLQDKLNALDALITQLNTGTGRVNISSEFPGVAWASGGGLFIERRGPFVVFYVAAVDFGEAAINYTAKIPPGFRPGTFVYETMSVATGAGRRQIDVTSGGTVRVRAATAPGNTSGSMVWTTTNDWPV